MTDVSATHLVLSRAAADRSSRTRLAYLDGWRGLSIALVLIGHFVPVPGINLGVLGVEFFFVLSGRLMAEILFIEHIGSRHSSSAGSPASIPLFWCSSPPP
jgi:peptidoglycan/LPS O-acetylase OafA/YrhL